MRRGCDARAVCALGAREDDGVDDIDIDDDDDARVVFIEAFDFDFDFD